MMTDQLKNRIAQVAAANPFGFTFNPSQNKLATVGYVVATKDTQDCFGKAGLWKVIKYCLRHPGLCIGGWLNEDGVMQYDASMVFYDINEAVAAALENDQRAFYNLYTGREVMASQYAFCRKAA